MKRSDLHRKRADMMDMCEGTHVHHLDCIRLVGAPVGKNPSFTGNIEDYTFALAIVEDKPVFAGDVLYHKDGSKYIVQEVEKHNNGRLAFRAIAKPWTDGDFVENYTWTKPDESNTVSLSNVFGLSNEIIKVKLTKSGTGKISAEVVE